MLALFVGGELAEGPFGGFVWVDRAAFGSSYGSPEPAGFPTTFSGAGRAVGRAEQHGLARVPYRKDGAHHEGGARRLDRPMVSTSPAEAVRVGHVVRVIGGRRAFLFLHYGIVNQQGYLRKPTMRACAGSGLAIDASLALVS